jgi:very-short-patch-repair endonuclease
VGKREGDPKYPLARRLRRSATDAERKLWAALRGRQLGGYKIRRQQPIGPYIVDFVCHDVRLVIELDGGQHATANEVERTRRIESDGYRVLRFWNPDVLRNLDGVLATILDALNEGK